MEENRRLSPVSFREPLLVYFLVGLCFVAALGLPVLNVRYVYPRILEQLAAFAEEEATRIANHLSRFVDINYAGRWIHTSDEMKNNFEQTVDDFHLWKLRLFSPSGIILYSSDPAEIGITNNRPYFKDIVARGVPFNKVVRKGRKSMDGDIVVKDVVEAYIPRITDGRFKGAWEIYFDISERRQALGSLVKWFNALQYALSVCIMVVGVVAGLGIRRSHQARIYAREALLQMANTDVLTGAMNRRSFHSLAQWEAEKFSRYERDACVLMIDIDHFKHVNDTHGHQTGDEVLVLLAGIGSKSLRASDIFARYGGEEFVAYLPETNMAGAMVVAERLRKTVEASELETAAGKLKITISVGVSSLEKSDELCLIDAIKRADEALYKAKGEGRNRVRNA